MHDDPIIELIAKQPMTRLNEMELELEQLAERARFGLEQVRKAKEFKAATRGTRGPSPAVRSNGNGRGNKRVAIKRLLEADTTRIWRPGDVSRALAEQQIELSRDGCRVTMNRMVDDHELEKLADGYKARDGTASHTASPNGVHPDGEDRELLRQVGS